MEHGFRTRPRRQSCLGALWGLINERQVPTSSSYSWIVWFLGTLAQMVLLLSLKSMVLNLSWRWLRSFTKDGLSRKPSSCLLGILSIIVLSPSHAFLGFPVQNWFSTLFLKSILALSRLAFVFFPNTVVIKPIFRRNKSNWSNWSTFRRKYFNSSQYFEVVVNG